MKHTLTTLAALLLISLGMSAETRVTLHKAGTLASQLSQVQQDTISSLTIEGPINSADIRLLRRMAGYRESEGDPVGKLRTLDLRNARITSDKEPYLVLDANKENLSIISELQPHMGEGARFEFKTAQNQSRVFLTYNDIYKIQYVLNNDTTFYQDEVIDLEPSMTRVTLGKENSKNMESTISKFDMKHIIGHKLKQKNGHYVLYCYLNTNYFPMDLFYMCPNMEAVSIPEKAKINDQIIVLNDEIRYYQFNKEKKKSD